VPRAYKEKWAYKNQNVEKGATKSKNEGKGPYKGQNAGNRPSKFFCSAKNSKSDRAYKSLNPGLVLINRFL
jgi:hypothetical protein